MDLKNDENNASSRDSNWTPIYTQLMSDKNHVRGQIKEKVAIIMKITEKELDRKVQEVIDGNSCDNLNIEQENLESLKQILDEKNKDLAEAKEDFEIKLEFFETIQEKVSDLNEAVVSLRKSNIAKLKSRYKHQSQKLKSLPSKYGIRYKAMKEESAGLTGSMLEIQNEIENLTSKQQIDKEKIADLKIVLETLEKKKQDKLLKLSQFPALLSEYQKTVENNEKLRLELDAKQLLVEAGKKEKFEFAEKETTLIQKQKELQEKRHSIHLERNKFEDELAKMTEDLCLLNKETINVDTVGNNPLITKYCSAEKIQTFLAEHQKLKDMEIDINLDIKKIQDDCLVRKEKTLEMRNQIDHHDVNLKDIQNQLDLKKGILDKNKSESMEKKKNNAENEEKILQQIQELREKNQNMAENIKNREKEHSDLIANLNNDLKKLRNDYRQLEETKESLKLQMLETYSSSSMDSIKSSRLFKSKKKMFSSTSNKPSTDLDTSTEFDLAANFNFGQKLTSSQDSAKRQKMEDLIDLNLSYSSSINNDE